MSPATLPRSATMTRNVLRVFRAATTDDVREGREWYARAHDAARDLAAILPGTDTEAPDPDAARVVRAAAVIAVLSPMTPWARNVELARMAYTRAADGATFADLTAPSSPLRLPTVGAHARKAAAIVLGADPASVVSGPKVTPFWARIVDAATGATGPSSVVVDRHAHDVALHRVTDDATRGRNLSRKGGQEAFAMAYVRAAAALRRTGEAPGITPAELQAVTWIVWRREHGHAMAKAEARRDARANGAGRTDAREA